MHNCFRGARVITHLWVPPFASEQIRRRLWAQARNIDDLIAAEDREGEREARRITAMGVTLAGAAGWDATPSWSEPTQPRGLRSRRPPERVDADLVIVAARGLGGAASVLGSVSDMVVHYCSRPVLAVPSHCCPKSTTHFWTGRSWSDGTARKARGPPYRPAERLFPDRRIVAVSVDDATKVPAQPDADSNGRLVHVHIDRGRGRQARGTATAIVAAADEQRCRGRRRFERTIRRAGDHPGSVAMGVLHESHRPVMVVLNRSQPEGS